MHQRQRLVAVAVAALCSAAFSVSCTRRPPTTSPPAGNDRVDCGTIVIGEPAADKVACFMGYHLFAEKRLTTVETVGTTKVTITYHAKQHNMDLTKTVTDAATGRVVSQTEKHCTGGGAQVLMDDAGRPGPLSNCTI